MKLLFILAALPVLRAQWWELYTLEDIYRDGLETHLVSNYSCVYNDRGYNPWDIVETPHCEFCRCYRFRGPPHRSVVCKIPRCPPPLCADSQDGIDPRCPHCSRRCPNGENCRAETGEIIPNGSNVTVADGRTCHCEELGLNGFYLNAVCS